MIYFLAELLHAAVLEAYGVEHARRGLRHAGIGVALAVRTCGALDDETAQTLEVDKVGKLLAVAEGAAGRHHRVFKTEIMDFNC